MLPREARVVGFVQVHVILGDAEAASELRD